MKKLLQIVFVLFLSIQGFTQTVTPPPYADIDTNHRTYVNQVFGLLEPSRVNTGLLIDYGFDFSDLKIYNGSVLVDSTLMEQGLFSDLYKTLYTSRFNSSVSGMRHPTVNDSLCYIARQREVITLSGLLFKYNNVDPNAQANGKMQTVNGRLKDVYINSVWQNPYQEDTTLAISPSIISYNLTYCKVVLPSNLWLTNMASQVSNIQMDAGDGVGYRTITMGTQINLNYADTGWKRWIFKVTLTNSQLLYSHCKIHFNNTSNMAGSNGIAARGTIDRNRNIVATELYNGVYGVAGIVISYHSQTDQVLRRPLIVAEGFDPGHITKPEEPEGQNTFESFITGVRSSGSTTLRNLISGNPGLNDPSDYDIVYVNWYNGTNYLQANELILEAVIRWVNANKQPLAGVRQPNVVLGSSMGGVIARMALGRMDRGGGQNGPGGFAAHETRLFVSLDAPHQGANVPLGYQAMARHASKVYIRTGPAIVGLVELVQFITNGPSPLQAGFLADQPAAKQLLNQRLDFSYNQSNSSNQQFLQELRAAWAYPNPTNNAANTRCVAISDGSECAVDQEFTPGANLLYHYRSTKTRFIGDIFFMAAGLGLSSVTGVIPVLPFLIPGSSKFELTLDVRSLANGGGNQVYYGNIKITKKVLWLVSVSINLANKTYNAPLGLLPFETYPGGFYLVTLGNQPGSVSQDWMFNYNNSFLIQRRFMFLPTTSALDIGRGNTPLTSANYLAKYVGATPPVTPFNTPFANFNTAFNENPITYSNLQNTYQVITNGDLEHEGLLIRNANWLAEEMNGNINIRSNCSAFCGNASVGGKAILCNAETYIMDNGAVVNWTVAPTGIVNPPNPATGAVTNLTRITNGTITLTGTITSANCGTRQFTKIITVGSPALTITNSRSTTCSNGYQTWTLNADPSAGTNWQWSVGSLWNGSSQISIFNPSSPSTMANVKGGGALRLNYTDVCGIAKTDGVTIYSSCPPAFMVAPNPAMDEVTITAGDASTTSRTSLPDLIYSVKISDRLGGIRKSFEYKTPVKSVSLFTNGLEPGIYSISIFNGTVWSNKKLIVQRR